eukprot:TRINITY_DN689_c0_g3_i1.p2 TRINITY_DN689_c0_g3~~TRINITY_DN689_c0_g3_i1.p2  ORF type:complete len:189 (+),score=-27.60 TRINITY_DN689_c0_g3_i1:1370-1936(+)
MSIKQNFITKKFNLRVELLIFSTSILQFYQFYLRHIFILDQKINDDFFNLNKIDVNFAYTSFQYVQNQFKQKDFVKQCVVITKVILLQAFCEFITKVEENCRNMTYQIMDYFIFLPIINFQLKSQRILLQQLTLICQSFHLISFPFVNISMRESLHIYISLYMQRLLLLLYVKYKRNYIRLCKLIILQ